MPGQNKPRKMIMTFFIVLLNGLVAGLLYGYSCSVNPGLNKLTDAQYISAMQSINTAILNPVFFLAFIGILPLYPIALLQLRSTAGIHWLLCAGLVYFGAVFFVTMLGNVPLNNQLAKFIIHNASESEIGLARTSFEKPWNRLHSIRTIGSIVSFALAIVYLFKSKP